MRSVLSTSTGIAKLCRHTPLLPEHRKRRHCGWKTLKKQKTRQPVKVFHRQEICLQTKSTCYEMLSMLISPPHNMLLMLMFLTENKIEILLFCCCQRHCWRLPTRRRRHIQRFVHTLKKHFYIKDLAFSSILITILYINIFLLFILNTKTCYIILCII